MASLPPEVETAVLNWLLEDPEVARAVDLAAVQGKEPESKPVLLKALRALQGTEAPELASVASPPTPPSPISLSDPPAPVQPATAASSSSAGRQVGEKAKWRLVEDSSADPSKATPWKPSPSRWKIEVPEVLETLGTKGILPKNCGAVTRPEVFLLQPGISCDDLQEANKMGIAKETYVAMREALEALKGEALEVSPTEVVVAPNFVCVRVSLPPMVPCQHKDPHILLGLRAGVQVRRWHAVKLLAETKAGQKPPGVTVIPMDKGRTIKGRLVFEP